MDDTRAADAREAAFQEQTKSLLAKYEAMLSVLDRPPPRTYAELPEHVRKWLEDKNARDLAEIDEAQQLIDRLPTETRNWLKGKNAKDLQNIDAAVEFIGSSRTAARVLS